MKRRGRIAGLVVFLLIGGGLVLANPLFWGIINAEFGAAHYQVIEANGARRDVISGRKGPWPEWAPGPGGARVVPQVSYSAAPGHPATGYGDAAFEGTALASARATAAMLTDAGWAVEEARRDVAYPSIPPRPTAFCILMARRADAPERFLLYVFEMTPHSSKARIHWFVGAPGPAFIHPPSDCSVPPQ
jgi:hypothetical protein